MFDRQTEYAQNIFSTVSVHGARLSLLGLPLTRIALEQIFCRQELVQASERRPPLKGDHMPGLG